MTAVSSSRDAIRAAFDAARQARTSGGLLITERELENIVEVAMLDDASPMEIDDGERQALRDAWTGHFAQGGFATGYAQRVFKARFDPSFEYKRPDYSAPTFAPFRAVEVQVPSGSATLTGTLLLPKGKGPFPAVVFASGSGPDPRDAGYARVLAELLASQGVASLRFDDRGQGGSSPLPPGGWQSVDLPERAADVKAAVAFLRGYGSEQGRGVIAGDRIGLIGHSEGGWTAPWVAADDPSIVAVAALAAPGAKGAAIMAYQMGDVRRRMKAQLAELEAAPMPEEDKARMRAQLQATLEAQAPILRAAQLAAEGQSVPAEILARLPPYLRSFIQYDPLKTARRVTQPTLLLQGTADWNVRAEQVGWIAEAMREAGNTQVEVGIYDGLDHTFMQDAAYNIETADLPPDRDWSDALSFEVTTRIADWMTEKLTRADYKTDSPGCGRRTGALAPDFGASAAPPAYLPASFSSSCQRA
jgi:pimeloyl-ACP methyl ester carboxylesterase